MPTLPPHIIDPVWEQFAALLPERAVEHPLGCHRPRVPDRVVFDKLVQVLVFGCAYWRIPEEGCSATTLRRRRDEWMEAGAMEKLEEIARDSYNRIIGLAPHDTGVNCCITKAPCGGERAGRSPVDRGKRGIERSTVVDAAGVPLGTISAPANHHDSPLLAETLDALGSLLDGQEASVHLNRGYDSDLTRKRLEEHSLGDVISEKAKKPAPVGATKRWVVERTISWQNAHKKLVWCTERRVRVVDFWISFSTAIVIVGRPIRKAWSRHRWEGRPSRRP